MRVSSLPARLAYTVVAAPVGWAAGFYSCMRFLPEFAIRHPQLDPNQDGVGVFRIAILAGAAIALIASLFALTLPWIRHRKKPGRPGRLAFSCVLVVLTTIFFADLGYRLIYDLIFAAWLTYLLTFTLVRYGIIDEPRRASSSYGRRRRTKSIE